MTMRGTLALVGAGEFLETMCEVDRELLRRAGGNRVAVLPTASAPDGPGVPERWARMGVEHFTAIGADAVSVLALDRSECDDESNADRVRSADLIYFSGGKPDYLLKTLQGTALWKAVLAVLERGGVLAGCSAGAMIMGEYVPAFSISGALHGDRWHRAFELVPHVVILPHYNEFPELLVKLLYGRPTGTTVLGIDAHTALVGRDATWEVMGAGRVTVQSEASTRRYHSGQSIEPVFS